MKNLLLLFFFLSVLAGCPEKRLTPDPVPVDTPKATDSTEAIPPQSWLSYKSLLGYEGRLAPHAGPNTYLPLRLLA